MSLKSAAQAVSILVSAFRTPNGVDDQTFVRLAAQALEHQPDWVLLKMAHPREGLIAQSRFMPSIAEMVEFCKKEVYDAIPEKPKPQPIEHHIAPEERERILDRFRELTKGLGKGSSFDRESPKPVQLEGPELEASIREQFKGVQEALERADLSRLLWEYRTEKNGPGGAR